MSACVLPACLSLPACVLVAYVLPACVLPVCILHAYLSCLPVSNLPVCHACLSAKDYAEYIFCQPNCVFPACTPIYLSQVSACRFPSCLCFLPAGRSVLPICMSYGNGFLSAITCPDYLLRSGFVCVFELLYISLSSDILYDVHILCLLSLF
jgi:hypothetical protein